MLCGNEEEGGGAAQGGILAHRPIRRDHRQPPLPADRRERGPLLPPHTARLQEAAGGCNSGFNHTQLFPNRPP